MDKRIAPTIILILMVFFILLQAGGLVFALKAEGIGLFWKTLAVVIPLLLIIALIGVYIERIREIGEDESEDLDRY